MQEIKEIFTKSPKPNLFKYTQSKKMMGNREYSIFPITMLDKFIATISDKKATTVRFLVDMKYQLWFAEEGAASKKIPAHYQMTNEPPSAASCISAGNIIFSSDYQTITHVNHKSGDFRPDFNSLQYLFAILIANEDKLTSQGISINPELCVEEIGSSGGDCFRNTLSPAEIKLMVEKLFTKEQMIAFKAQPNELRISYYEDSRLKRRSDFFQDRNLSLASASKRQDSGEKKFRPFELPAASAKENQEEESVAVCLFGFEYS